VDHAVAVCAQQREVLELGLRALDERLNGSGVVRLDEAPASLTVVLLEVEMANFAAKVAR
jgi:hypothetical protein